MWRIGGIGRGRRTTNTGRKRKVRSGGGTREVEGEKEKGERQSVKYHTQIFKGHCSTLRGSVVLK